MSLKKLQCHDNYLLRHGHGPFSHYLGAKMVRAEYDPDGTGDELEVLLGYLAYYRVRDCRPYTLVSDLV